METTFKKTHKLLAVLIGILLVAIPVAASVNLFVHQMKPVTAAVVQDNCEGGLTAMSLPPATGTGNVLFGCNTPTGAAPFTVHTGGGVVGVWLANDTNHVVYLVSTSTVPCSGGIHVLERGNFTFTPAQAGNYWYCLEGVGSPTPWIDVHWYVN